MEQQKNEAAYAELLRDLAHAEPRNGYQSATDLPLTAAQAAVVVRQFPDVVGEALVGHEHHIASVMVASTHALELQGPRLADDRERKQARLRRDAAVTGVRCQEIGTARVPTSILSDPMARAWMDAWAAKCANDTPRAAIFPVQNAEWKERIDSARWLDAFAVGNAGQQEMQRETARLRSDNYRLRVALQQVANARSDDEAYACKQIAREALER